MASFPPHTLLHAEMYSVLEGFCDLIEKQPLKKMADSMFTTFCNWDTPMDWNSPRKLKSVCCLLFVLHFIV